MLLGMKSQIEAMRGLCYEVAADLDRANKIEDKDEREKAQSMLELMIPVAKVSKLKGRSIKVIGSSFIISIAIKTPTRKTLFFR